MALEDLYREVIIDHFRNPRNRTPLDTISGHAEGHNPLCGDQVDIDVHIEHGEVTEIAVSGQGCSISQAAASMMSEAVKGQTLEAVAELTDQFKTMMSIKNGDSEILDSDRPGSVLGDLEALQGVRKFPVRIKCANLSFTTLAEAIAEAPPNE